MMLSCRLPFAEFLGRLLVVVGMLVVVVVVVMALGVAILVAAAVVVVMILTMVLMPDAHQTEDNLVEFAFALIVKSFQTHPSVLSSLSVPPWSLPLSFPLITRWL